MPESIVTVDKSTAKLEKAFIAKADRSHKFLSTEKLQELRRRNWAPKVLEYRDSNSSQTWNDIVTFLLNNGGRSDSSDKLLSKLIGNKQIADDLYSLILERIEAEYKTYAIPVDRLEMVMSWVRRLREAHGDKDLVSKIHYEQYKTHLGGWSILGYTSEGSKPLGFVSAETWIHYKENDPLDNLILFAQYWINNGRTDKAHHSIGAVWAAMLPKGLPKVYPPWLKDAQDNRHRSTWDHYRSFTASEEAQTCLRLILLMRHRERIEKEINEARELVVRENPDLLWSAAGRIRYRTETTIKTICLGLDHAASYLTK